MTPFCARLSAMYSLFQLLTYSRNSRSAPTKFVPLSLIIVSGCPRLAMNLAIAFKQESVSSFGTTSRWTALTTKQVKRQHHLFSVLLPIVMDSDFWASRILVAWDPSRVPVSWLGQTRGIECAEPVRS